MKSVGLALVSLNFVLCACASESAVGNASGARTPGAVSVRLTTPIPDTVRGRSLYVDVQLSGAFPRKDATWYLDGKYIGSLAHEGSLYTSADYSQRSDSQWTLFVTQDLSPGSHQFLVRATDSTKTVDSLFSAFFVRIDTVRYQLQPLPDLGGSYSEPRDINVAGVVAGVAGDNKGKLHPVLWTNGAVQVLPDSGKGAALALNNVGDVVGLAQDPRLSRDCIRGVIWRNGGAEALLPAYPAAEAPDTTARCLATANLSSAADYCDIDCTAEATWPVAINDRRSILTHRVLDRSGVVTVLTSPYDQMYRGLLNNADQAVFTARATPAWDYNAYSRRLGGDALSGPTQPTSCSQFFRLYTYASGMNDQGSVVGTQVACETRAYITNALAQTSDLSSIAGALSAVSINNAGDILFAGTYGDAPMINGTLAPHILRGGRVAAIAPAQSGWVITRLVKMNDSGVIIATASDAAGISHGVTLTPPVP